jgi:hypothetical protein
LRRRLARHHEVDLAVRMAMVPAGDVLHLDDVDREAVGGLARLHHPAVLDARVLAAAHPAGGDARREASDDRLHGGAVGREPAIQVRLERSIERARADRGGDRRHQFAEFGLGHRNPLSKRRRVVTSARGAERAHFRSSSGFVQHHTTYFRRPLQSNPDRDRPDP